MSPDPLVSVIIPAYNAKETIAEAIASLMRQTYPRIEVIVADDGSTDGTGTEVGKFTDPRVTIVQKPHKGVAETFNAAGQLARGEYIARLDADDVAHERRIEKQVRYLEKHPEIGLIGSWATIEEEDGRRWMFEAPRNEDEIRRHMLWDNPFISSSVMMRRSAFYSTGGFPDGLFEDYRLWIRIARRWKVAVLPEVLVTYRIRQSSRSHQVQRTKLLWQRLRGQWDAAWMLGPWRLALPALLVTACGCMVSLFGGWIDKRLRILMRRPLMWIRGDARSQE